MSKKSRQSLIKADRQAKVAKILRQNPYLSTKELAKILKIAPSTLRADIQDIKLNFVKMSTEDFLFHRNRVLREIQDMKKRCITQLNKLKGQPTKGARWIEEYTKLIEKEAKILGLYAPELRLLAIKKVDGDILDKHNRDAAIDAALFGVDSGDVIDILPKMISHETN